MSKEFKCDKCEDTGKLAMFPEAIGIHGDTVTNCSYEKAKLTQEKIKDKVYSLQEKLRRFERGSPEHVIMSVSHSRIIAVPCICTMRVKKNEDTNS